MVIDHMIKYIRIFSLGIASVIVTLFLLEISLQIARYTPKEVWWQWVTNPDNEKFMLDPQRIYKLHKGITVDFEQNTPIQTIDDLGHRRSPCVQGSETWLFVGDSFVYGHGVNDDETYPSYVYKEMSNRGRQICVINLGVQGYSLGPSFVAFQEALLNIKPDVVVWGIRPDDFLDTAQEGVIKVANGTVVVRGAWMSGVFLQGMLHKTVGRTFPRSLLLNMVMYSLQADRVNDQFIDQQIHTLPHFVTYMKALAKKSKFTLYYVLTPTQSIVMDPVRTDNPENTIYTALRQTLLAKGEQFFDMNAHLIPVFYNELNATIGLQEHDIFQSDGHLTARGNMLLGKFFYGLLLQARSTGSDR